MKYAILVFSMENLTIPYGMHWLQHRDLQLEQENSRTRHKNIDGERFIGLNKRQLNNKASKQEKKGRISATVVIDRCNAVKYFAITYLLAS